MPKLTFNFKSIAMILIFFVFVSSIATYIRQKNNDSYSVALWETTYDILDESINNAEFYNKYNDDQSLYGFQARLRTLSEIAVSFNYWSTYHRSNAEVYQDPSSLLNLLLNKKDNNLIHSYLEVCKNDLLEFRNTRGSFNKYDQNKDDYLSMWDKLMKDTSTYTKNL